MGKKISLWKVSKFLYNFDARTKRTGVSAIRPFSKSFVSACKVAKSAATRAGTPPRGKASNAGSFATIPASASRMVGSKASTAPRMVAPSVSEKGAVAYTVVSDRPQNSMKTAHSNIGGSGSERSG